MAKSKPEPTGAYPQVISEFRHTKIANITHANAQVVNKREIIAGTSTQAVGDKIHLDTTPSLDGTDYPGNSSEVQSWTKEDGSSPIIEWRWLVDGKEASNSAEMEDPFHFGSYEDNGGCTPSLKLLRQVGPGRFRVEAFPFVRAEYNGGVAVQGKPATWYID